MKFLAWMYDIAREQAPTADRLAELLAQSAAAGYDAVGLYLEHRFEYRSAPWAAAPGALSPAALKSAIATARAAGPTPRVIPFLNSLGHMEGFIRSEDGWFLGETHEVGRLSLQVCPCRDECRDFVKRLLADVIAAFDDEWLHIGGDEAWELGKCARCAARVEKVGKAGLFGEYYGELCRWVLRQGRRPGLWADMLLEHPAAMDHLPRETLLFDWQYFDRPRTTTRRLRDRGFEVVCCPSVQSYNSIWAFLAETQRNIDEHVEDAHEHGALGVCVTTWEYSFLTNFPATFPLVLAAGRRIRGKLSWDAALRAVGGEQFAVAAEILGNRIPAAAKSIAPGTWRVIRDRMLVRQNPFYLWADWREEACQAPGDAILRLCDEVDALLPNDSPLRFPALFYRVSVQWVRAVEAAHRAYAARDLPGCCRALSAGAALLAQLEAGAAEIARPEVGGSRADVFRVRAMVERVQTVIRRIESLESDGVVVRGRPYLPAFQMITHDAYIPHDYAGWRTGMYR
ncbi:MAG: family 20 glycosylhydrolase [Planctomycetia bacterium]|nr:MAG: family 20 glycosylhydrolase [Planctomycetia bacterium]